MGTCLKKLRTPTLDENVLVGLIEDTKLNQAVLQGWYEEFIGLFPEGVAREEGFVEVGMKICHGGDHSQPEDLVRIIFNHLAETDDRVVTFSSHFNFESFAVVLDAVRKMRGEVAIQASLRDVFEALSDKKSTVDLHRFREVLKKNPQKLREVAANYDGMRAAPIRVYQ